jgi:hypothetical protein
VSKGAFEKRVGSMTLLDTKRHGRILINSNENRSFLVNDIAVNSSYDQSFANKNSVALP